MEQAKRTSVNTEAVKQKNAWLNAQLLWGCDAWNVTPEQAARQIVADLFEHLSRGGTVSVRIGDSGGKEHTLEVSARQKTRV